MKLRKDAIDITNKLFGDLTALKPVAPTVKRQRGIKWLCKCICGKECIASGGHLRAGMRVSCGCRSERRIKQTGINRLYQLYTKKARERNLHFNLNREQFATLITSNCYYCNRAPHQKLKRQKTQKTQIDYNGIDRYDPRKGYIPENAVSCCWFCNRAKHNLTFQEWKDHMISILNHRGITNGT